MWMRCSQQLIWNARGNRHWYSTGTMVKLASARYGDPAKDRQRSPLVICHGLFGQKQNWHSVAKAMQRRLACTIYAVDLRNHGESSWADSMTYDEMSGDVVEFLKSLTEETGFSQCRLLGHSMGGRVAMRLAVHPSWQGFVERLIIEDVSPKAYGSDFAAHVTFRRYIHAMAALDMAKSRKTLLHELEEIIPDLTTRQFLLTNLEHTDKGGRSRWRCNLKAIDKNLETILRYSLPPGSYNGPTLFCYGEKSDYVKKADRAEIGTYFPNARFAGIPNAGHWIHAEQPAAFIECVCEFLE